MKTEYTNIYRYGDGSYYHLISQQGFESVEAAYEQKIDMMSKCNIVNIFTGFKEPINRDIEQTSLNIIECPDYVINQKGIMLNTTKCSIENHTIDDYIIGSKHKSSKGKIYQRVTLKNINGVFVNHYIHIILAKCYLFNPDFEKYPKCDHIDNNSLNNNIDNLQQVTHRYNIEKDKDRESGYSNIYKQKSGKFRVKFASNTFTTIEEAIKDRDEVNRLKKELRQLHK